MNGRLMAEQWVLLVRKARLQSKARAQRSLSPMHTKLPAKPPTCLTSALPAAAATAAFHLTAHSRCANWGGRVSMDCRISSAPSWASRASAWVPSSAGCAATGRVDVGRDTSSLRWLQGDTWTDEPSQCDEGKIVQRD